MPLSAPLTDAEAIAATQALPEREISASALSRLDQYDWTLPRDGLRAAARAGFRWRRWVGRDRCPSGWVLGEYGAAEPDGTNAIHWQRAVIVNYSCLGAEAGSLAGFGFREVQDGYEAWCDRLPAGEAVVGAHWGALIASLLDLPARS